MTLALLILGSALIAGGGWVSFTGFSSSTQSLTRSVAALHRVPDVDAANDALWARFGASAAHILGPQLEGAVTRRRLHLVGRSAEAHAALLTVAALAGLVLPVVVALLLTGANVGVAGWMSSLIVGALFAAIAVLVVNAELESQATAASRDLRHQLSAYLDVLTMLLASNQGNESALRTAAEAGDGRLFMELRRRMLEAATAGRPAVTALGVLGRDLGLVELVEIAASASLATSQGAPVARSLAAKTESLRAALQAEQEQDARIRTGKITFPLVAMGLVFIVLGLYPALVSIQNT